MLGSLAGDPVAAVTKMESGNKIFCYIHGSLWAGNCSDSYAYRNMEFYLECCQWNLHAYASRVCNGLLLDFHNNCQRVCSSYGAAPCVTENCDSNFCGFSLFPYS